MYCRGLGFHVAGSFANHNGFDGVMLGLEGANYHLEFTCFHPHPVAALPTTDDLLVFYLPAAADWQAACDRMLAAGFEQVPSVNPYWELRGRTFRDPDGYRVVLQQDEWREAGKA